MIILLSDAGGAYHVRDEGKRRAPICLGTVSLNVPDGAFSPMQAVCSNFRYQQQLGQRHRRTPTSIYPSRKGSELAHSHAVITHTKWTARLHSGLHGGRPCATINGMEGPSTVNGGMNNHEV